MKVRCGLKAKITGRHSPDPTSWPSSRARTRRDRRPAPQRDGRGRFKTQMQPEFGHAERGHNVARLRGAGRAPDTAATYLRKCRRRSLLRQSHSSDSGASRLTVQRRSRSIFFMNSGSPTRMICWS